jgi:hypothetical protein
VANLDGSGTPSSVIASGLSAPADLRYLPPASVGLPGQLYFADESGGAIRRIGTDGSGLTTLIATSSPYYLDLDPAAGKIYWGNNGANLRSGPLAGGAEGPILYNSGQNMRGVCVDAAAGMLYWCEKDSRAIFRRSIAGGDIQTIYSGLHTPHGLVLDLPAGKLYWADTGTNSGGGFNPKGISRGDLSGAGSAEALVTNANSQQAWDIDLDTRTPGYTQWTQRFFRVDATAGTKAVGADPDADGAINLLEHALGTGPMNASSLPTTTALRVFDGGVEYPAVKFRRRIGATDVVYRVQTSTNLTSWVDNSITPNTTVEVGAAGLAEDGMEVATVRSTTPLSETKQFLRVRVVTP